MTRALFLSQLRQGLRGLDPAEIDEICDDYEAHFVDAASAGKEEKQICATLGNPVLLAKEWRAERGLSRWETQRGPKNFLRASYALIAFAALDMVILLPILVCLIVGAATAAYVFFVIGQTGLHLMAGFFFGGGDVLVPVLIGVAVIFGVVGAIAVIALLLGVGLRLLGRYFRHHNRLN